jgi:hypothetical protein
VDREGLTGADLFWSLGSTALVTLRVMANLITVIKGLIMHQVGWLIKSKSYRRVSM